MGILLTSTSNIFSVGDATITGSITPADTLRIVGGNPETSVVYNPSTKTFTVTADGSTGGVNVEEGNGIQVTVLNNTATISTRINTTKMEYATVGGKQVLSIKDSYFDGRYIMTETDPTVPAHVKSITTTNISNWNTAYSWGDHSTAGYLSGSGANTQVAFFNAVSSITSNSTFTYDSNSDLTVGRRVRFGGSADHYITNESSETRIRTSNSISFYTGGFNHRMVIQSGGGVAINRTSVQTGNILDVNGNTYLRGQIQFEDTQQQRIRIISNRIHVDAENQVSVAQFASYGMFLSRTGQTAGLYVNSPIEARLGIRFGTAAASGTITPDGNNNITVSDNFTVLKRLSSETTYIGDTPLNPTLGGTLEQLVLHKNINNEVSGIRFTTGSSAFADRPGWTIGTGCTLNDSDYRDFYINVGGAGGAPGPVRFKYTGETILYKNSSVGMDIQHNRLSIIDVNTNTAGAVGAMLDLHNFSGTTSATTSIMSGIRFKNVATDTNTNYKAGIVFRRTASAGRGNLVFLLNNSTATTNVSAGEASHLALTLFANKTITAYGNITAPDFVLSSDIRLKENIQSIGEHSDGINYYSFHYLRENGLRYGVIAQEIENIYPSLISVGDDGYKRVSYLGLHSIEISKLKTKIAHLEEKIKQLEQ